MKICFLNPKLGFMVLTSHCTQKILLFYRKRSLKVTCNIDGKIGILGSSKVTVKLTEFLNKITCKFN